MAVVDASVWVSICHQGDVHHTRSRRWLERFLIKGIRMAAPNLIRVEVAAAVRRLTESDEIAADAAATLDSFEALELYDLTAERARRASRIATMTGVRGADAIYLELAADRCEELVTWDRQQLERGRSLARVGTP